MEDDKLNYLQYRMVQCSLVGVKIVGLVVIIAAAVVVTVLAIVLALVIVKE